MNLRLPKWFSLLMLYGGMAHGMWGSSVRCFLALNIPEKGHFTRLRARRGELDDLLKGTPAKGTKLIDVFSAVPEIKTLFTKPAGVKEGYTIVRHTNMVYDIYNEQIPFHDLGDLKLPGGGTGYRLLKAGIALHDIGKPAAIDMGDKNRQHEFTVPLVKRILGEVGFTEAEIKIINTLVDNDVIGACLRDRATVAESKAEVIRLAAEAGLPPKDFLRLQEVLFIADAASYPTVRVKAFNELPGGKLVMKNPKYEELKALFP